MKTMKSWSVTIQNDFVNRSTFLNQIANFKHCMIKLKHIFLMTFLIVALQAAGQSYVIDQVCVNSERQYRIEGEQNSTYLWLLTNSSGTPVTLSNPAGLKFNGTNAITGLPLEGSEITIQWTQTGTFKLAAVQYSVFGCDTLEQGVIEVVEDTAAPVSGGDLTACETIPAVLLDARNAIIPVSGTTVTWYDAPSGGTLVDSPTLQTPGNKIFYAQANNGTCLNSVRTPVSLTVYQVPATPEANVIIHPTCNDPNGTIEVTTPTGAEYTYSIDNVAYQASVIFQNLKTNIYTIRVRNIVSGCESVAQVNVPSLPPVPTLTIVETEDCICYGGNGSISFEFSNVADGIYPITYDGGQFANVNVSNNQATVIVPAGIYNNMTIEANGCVSEEKLSVTIHQPDPILITELITEIDLKSQRKGSISLTVSGGSGPYLYQWSNEATTSDIKDLFNGTYTVIVTDRYGCVVFNTIVIPIPNSPPTAIDDEFDAGCSAANGDLLKNDFDNDNDDIYIEQTPVQTPDHGTLTLNADGTFEYLAEAGFTGDDAFQYAIFDVNHYQGDTARVVIHIISDFDCDGIPDTSDDDADGDGITNTDEGETTTDTDEDGHPNWLDIDADNDGIVDLYESQPTTSNSILLPKGLDSDHDGIDDTFDPDQGGTRIIPVDTDRDEIPDFLDADSDNDFVPDYIEGHDKNADGKPDYSMIGKDTDNDGLDDAYDIVDRYQSPIENMTGSNAPMQDFDGDGMKDWRDENDDNDEFLTRFEDLNADGDFSNDDTDFDGHPEYLDFGRDCDLLIPEAFSPNGDNIHDYFQIYCIDHFPNAIMYIFDQLGNKIFQKDHYGNLKFWDSAERAWWDGRTDNRSASGSGEMAAPGTYYYVLKLGNGEVKKSYVFVSY